MNINDCKGCLVYEKNIYCTIKKSPTIMCPCTNCIVKMICNIPCSDYKDCEKESIAHVDR